MNIPLRIVRRPSILAAADAFLVVGDALADACARLGGELPAVHPVAGGVLLVPREPSAAVVPGAVRLRRVGGDVFVPVDAQLVPELLPDELAGLSERRGLVLTPAGGVFAFDPVPLAVDDWLRPPAVDISDWERFPDPTPLPDRLTVIERPAQPIEVEDPFAEGRPGGADPLAGSGPVPEDARPPAGSLAERAKANAKLAAGQFIAWVGRQLNRPGLAKAGADLARRALEQVPRLTEKVLGAQEAALREVLRQLQSGNVNDALKRAPIAVADPAAGPGTVDHGANLGTRDPRFDLRSLLAGGGGGAGWLGGGDVWGMLAAEYRRLAANALQRGDHRRAAYLLGVLLRDARSAANALLAGNLCRPAAILLRDKLKDIPAAAAAFDRAGDVDEAVRLYERVEDYESAARVLRRAGDDDRAADYFRRAAEALARGLKYAAAGDLVRRELGDLDSARDYHRIGWVTDTPDAVTCAERLFDGYATAGEPMALVALLADAETRLAPPRSADAARFFNHARAHAAAIPAELRADLDDRARLLFARHLRESPGTTPAALFAGGADWAGPVVRDATVAAKAFVRVTPPASDHPPPMELVGGPVAAVAVAWSDASLVVAGRQEVVLWRPADGRVERVATRPGERVLGLAVDITGADVYVLSRKDDRAELECFSAVDRGRFHFEAAAWVADLGLEDQHYLGPIAGPRDGGALVNLYVPGHHTQFTDRLRQRTELEAIELLTYLRTAGPGGRADNWLWQGQHVDHWAEDADVRAAFAVPWVPAGPFAAPTVEWLTPEASVLEVTGVTADDNVCWSRFDARGEHSSATASASANAGRFVAAALVSPGVVVAATADNRVHTLRPSGPTLHARKPPLRVDSPAKVVALVPRSSEIVAVLADGTAVRLPRV